MDELRWEGCLRILTQSGALCVAAIYVVGFLIISIYHIRYGIPEFNFLHSKIISAGVLFFVLLALPLWELAGLYDWIRIPLKPTPPEATCIEKEVTRPELTPFLLRIFMPTFRISLFLGASFGIAFFLNLILIVNANASSKGWALACVLLSAPAFASAPLLATKSRKFQVIGLALVLITLPIFAFGAWKTHDRGFQLFFLWFLVCGITTRGVLNAKKDPHRLLNQSLHNVLLNTLLPLLFFAAYLYPRIRPVVGGGAPAPIIVYCTDVPPFAASNEVKAKLLDETDLGFYLLLSPDDKQAVFLPRSGVRAVKFVSR